MNSSQTRENTPFFFWQDWINGAAHHTDHHLYYSFNYGQFFTLWDRIGGSHRNPGVCVCAPLMHVWVNGNIAALNLGCRVSSTHPIVFIYLSSFFLERQFRSLNYSFYNERYAFSRLCGPPAGFLRL